MHVSCLAEVIWKGCQDTCTICLAPWENAAYATALEVLLATQEGEEDQAKINLRLGAHLLQRGFFRDGRAAVRSSLAARPCAEGWLELAAASLAQNRPERATRLLTTALGHILDGRLRTDRHETRFKLQALWGSCRLAQGRLDEADAALRAALDSSNVAKTGALTFALHTLSRLMAARGRAHQSIDALRAVCELLERECTDPAALAVAQAELGIAEADLGVAEAPGHLRSALQVLKRRRHAGTADLVERARRSLGVFPAKRLRTRTHPEDVAE